MLSLFGILVYVAFRYEFSFAAGAVLAVIHDVLMTIGWYCLSGRQFDAPVRRHDGGGHPDHHRLLH
jgi:preprotein translocase subunit SecF